MTHPTSTLSRHHPVATAFVEACWLAAVILVPLAVNPWGFSYGLPKVAVFRGLTLMLLAAHFLALASSSVSINPRRWLRSPLVRPILLVSVVAVLSTAVSLDPRLSLAGTYFRHHGLYLMLCFVLWTLLIAFHLRTPAQRRRLAAGIVLAGSLVALTPFLESLRWGENPLTWRPGGSLGNPIFLGGYLVMAIPFTLAGVIGGLPDSSGSRQRFPIVPVQGEELFKGAWRRGREAPRLHAPLKSVLPAFSRAVCFLALGLQVFALAVTQSRGPWVGMLAGLALFATLGLWPTRRRLLLIALAACALLAGALALGLNVDVVSVERMSRLPYVGRIVDAADTTRGTVRVRVVLWEMAGRVVTTWPEVGLEPDRLHVLRPLLGYGPDTASVIYTAAYPPELAHIEDPGAFWDRAHNEGLDVLTMRGWLGLAAWLVLGIACARRGLALWRAASDPIERAWAAAPLAALTAHVVEIQFAFSVTATMMMGWLCVGWLASPVAVQEIEEKERSGLGRPVLYAAAGALLLLFLAARLEAGALWADVLVARARAFDRNDQWQESIELYDRALGIVPWQATYHQLRAESFYNLARALPDEEIALKDELLKAADRGLGRARRLEPLELELYSNSGILHAYWSDAVGGAEHLESAAAFYQQAYRLGPTLSRLRVDLAHIYHSHGLYQDALDQYGAALAIDPGSVDAAYGAGLAWQALDRRDLARQSFQQALDLAPGCQACREALQAIE